MSSPCFGLSAEQLDALGAELDELERRTRAQLGEADAAYIRRLMGRARSLDLAGRALLLGSFFPPAWFAGTALLALAKILDNMEVGHNVMHGQYDFMNDPVIGTGYEWDIVADGEQWRRGHNYIHHTFTNVLGVDHDLGYRALRVSEEQPWHPKWLGNIPTALAIATFFEWAVGLHGTEQGDCIYEFRVSEWDPEKLTPLGKKIVRQVAKDYVLFPLLAGPMAVPVLLGNVTANVLRNYWAFAVIFCGHFPEGVSVFTEEQQQGETRGQWCLRQMLGSANLEGGPLLHLMSGHLSFQIEHHLFPTIPAWRYPQMAQEVRAIAEKYGIPYHTGRLGKQLRSVMKQIAVLSWPTSLEDALSWRRRAKAVVARKERGAEVVQGERRFGTLQASAAC